MGFLTDGTTIPWEEIDEVLPNGQTIRQYVKEHGVYQFLSVYRRLRDRQNDRLLWGDEVEFTLVKFSGSGDQRAARAFLRAHELLPKLQKITEKSGQNINWAPEYADYMVEATPGGPYGWKLDSMCDVECSMRERRRAVQQMLGQDEAILSLACFPLLGASPEATDPAEPVNGQTATSLFLSDRVIFPTLPRFFTLTANIRKRKGSKVAIYVPLFVDRNTVVDGFNESQFGGTIPRPLPPPGPHIYMDAMCFGMGCSCLQVTYQTRNIQEARYLYDQLAVLCPIFLALSAATPIVRGFLADTDVRWGIIADSVDDRTDGERGLSDLLPGEQRLRGSRYDTIDCYIGTTRHMCDSYNDVPVTVDSRALENLRAAGIDERLAQHIAHLFVRDPLVVYRESIEIDDETRTDHFENIQSTNWNTVRFKPPPPNTDIGWRVEFRPMECQLTDFENAALTVLSVLITRAILSFDLNLYIPISKLDINMQRARARDAVNTQRFFFRRDAACCDPNAACVEMTVDEIMNGSKKLGFRGLLPLVRSYIDSMSVCMETHTVLERYIELAMKRASGEIMTTASYLRSRVMKHPEYHHDSVVSPAVVHDVLAECFKVSSGELHPKELLGEERDEDERVSCADSNVKCA